MTTQIKTLTENVIKALSSVKEDNVSIADVAIDRRKLLEVLKLQNRIGNEFLTINYGKVAWRDSDYTVDNESCVQFSCNHTVMRFLNRPKSKNWQEPKIIPLNFVTRLTKTKLAGIPIDTQELIKALTFVLPCVAIETSRPVLNCILFESGDDILKLVAADGFRLGIDKVNASGVPTDQVLIDRADIARLMTFLKAIKPVGSGKSKYWPEVYVSYADKAIKFMDESGSAIKLDKQKGTFPNYALLIPKDGTKIEFISNDMLRAVKSVANIANDGSGIVRLNFKHGKPCGRITISAQSPEYGESSADCDALVEADCKIAANNRYLIDFLNQCKDSRLTMRVSSDSSPMVFEVDGRTSVIMPMFVQW